MMRLIRLIVVAALALALAGCVTLKPCPGGVCIMRATASHEVLVTDDPFLDPVD